MADLFSRITPRDIEQLNDKELVGLLHKLLYCEAYRLRLSKTGILVPAQTNIADGGRDGLFVQAPRRMTAFSSGSKTAFSCVSGGRAWPSTTLSTVSTGPG